MITETIFAVVIILGFIFLQIRFKGSKVYDYIIILSLPFIIGYLFINIREYNFTAYLMILFFIGGFIYQAFKFYNNYLKKA